ncbi:hypothetical protein FOA52_010982 [Chlamydomonas sp. UWO 241]|nr:hypothetical protein FOA52_010982 [Chlamydomonas sp. UWO 241]
MNPRSQRPWAAPRVALGHAAWIMVALSCAVGPFARADDQSVTVSTGHEFAAALHAPIPPDIIYVIDIMANPGDWLTRIIKLNPGVWLTFEQVTMRGFRLTIGPDSAYMCFSPGSVLHTRNVVSEYAIAMSNSWIVPSVKSVPRGGIPGVQEVYAWNGSFCFDTVSTSQCDSEAMRFADFSTFVADLSQGLGGSGGYESWYLNTIETAPKVLDPACIEKFGSNRCFADAVAAQIEIDFPSSPPPPRPGAPPAQSPVKVIAPVVVSCVVLMLIVAFSGWWYWRRRQALPLHLRFTEPQPGPDTTLVVTDIQDSTNMLETLPGDVMDECLVTHNTIMRRCLSVYHGSESATEGDAFIMAFHTATDAVSFCLAVQEQLMAAEWPAQLLAHASACEVFATPTRQLRLDYGTEETLTKPRTDDFSIHSGDRHTSARVQISLSLPHCNAMSNESLSTSLPLRTPTTFRTTVLTKGAVAKAASFSSPRSSGTFKISQFAGTVNLNALHMVLATPLEKVTDNDEEEGDAMVDHINRPWLEHLRNGWRLRFGAKNYTKAHEESCVSAGARIGTSDGQQYDLQANEMMLFRGIRVRMGVHSGVTAADISQNKASARTQYGGPSLSCARDVCNATPGGAVLLSRAAFLAVTTKGGRVLGAVMAHVGDFRTEAEAESPSEALPLYAAVWPQLLARLVAGAPLKVAEKVSGGVFDAPVGSVTINFMSMPCHKTLCEWRPELAHLAAPTFSTLVTACLHKHNGYVVEQDDGFCLSAFCMANDAVHYCIDMKVLGCSGRGCAGVT